MLLVEDNLLECVVYQLFCKVRHIHINNNMLRIICDYYAEIKKSEKLVIDKKSPNLWDSPFKYDSGDYYST